MTTDSQNAERDIWRSPDGRFRLVARVCDGARGLTTTYLPQTREAASGGAWRGCDSWEASQLLAVLARQLDGDAGVEEVAGC